MMRLPGIKVVLRTSSMQMVQMVAKDRAASRQDRLNWRTPSDPDNLFALLVRLAGL